MDIFVKSNYENLPKISRGNERFGCGGVVGDIQSLQQLNDVVQANDLTTREGHVRGGGVVKTTNGNGVDVIDLVQVAAEHGASATASAVTNNQDALELVLEEYFC
jgi:hypothetical protein